MKIPTALTSPRFLIDGHVHIMTPRRIRGGIRWIQKAVAAYRQLDPDTTPETLIQHLSEAGVNAFFNHFYPLAPGESREINRWQKEMADRHPQFLPFASLHPGDHDQLGIIEESRDELQLLGLKLHPYVQQFSILDPRLEKVYRRLQETGYPLVVHTGFSAFYRLPSLTEDFLELLRRFPGMKIAASHMLCNDISLEKLEEVAEQYCNLFLDATNVFWIYRPDNPLTGKLRELVKRFSSRIFFGSDYPMGMTFPAGRLYEQAFDLCPDQESLENVFWRTALAFTGLSESNIPRAGFPPG
ncbi:MAG: amidohydrolase family protein [Syntrophomonadaceae bacterium]|nr:amidohydrolase family protein [Syntrophomonadaceae bacterium]